MMAMIDIEIYYPKSELNPNGDPLPIQEAFHLAQKKYRMMAGGWGTGKTTAICLELSKDIAIQNNYILFGRKDLQEFKSTTLKEFLDIYEPAIAEHNKQDRIIQFCNGTQIYYTNLDDSREALKKIQSLNLGAAVIDQAEEISEAMFITIQGRLRRQNTRRCFYGAMNPNGHDWIWHRFFELTYDQYARLLFRKNPEKASVICKECDATVYRLLEKKYEEIAAREKKTQEQIRTLHTKSHYAGWISTSLENPFLPNDTLQAYLAFPDEVKKRYVYCSFDDFSGLCYKEYIEAKHKKPAYAPSDGDNIYMILDWGFVNPLAIGFFSVDSESKIRLYKIFYERNAYTVDVCKWIKEQPEWQRAVKFADPQIWQTQKDGKKIADDYERDGIYFEPAYNNVQQGIDRVNTLFKKDELWICENCIQWFGEQGEYRWKELKPGQIRNEYEEPVKKKDHLMDVTRYFANYWMTPEKEKVDNTQNWLKELIKQHDSDTSFVSD